MSSARELELLEAIKLLLQGGLGSRGGPADAMTVITNQTVSFDELASTASTPFNALTGVVRLFCDFDCFIEFGPTPIADNTSIFLPAGLVLDYVVTPGHRIAAIGTFGTGTLFITEGE